MAVVYDKLGRHADAEAELNRYQAAGGDAGAADQYAEIYAQWGDRPKALEWLDTAMRRSASGAAVIPIIGPLSQRPNFVSDLFGWSDYESIGASVRAALADSAVTTIAFFIDSPAGVVSGLPELADEIFASRRAKPSVAFVSNQCASAAFWCGAQATQLIAQPSADVGKSPWRSALMGHPSFARGRDSYPPSC